MMAEKFVSYFDFISPDNSLYYKNELRHKNLFSGVIFFFILICTILIAFYFLLKFYSRSDFITYTYNKNEDNQVRLYFDHKGLYHFIQLGQNPPPIDFRAVTLVAVRTNIYNYNFGKDFENNDFWVMGPCDKDDYEKVKEYLDPTTKFFNAACLTKMYNHTDGKIYHKNDKGFTFPYFVYGGDYAFEEQYSLVLEKCRNDSILTKYNLIEKNSCKSEEEIMEYLDKVHDMSLGIFDSNIDVGNYRNPIHKYFLRIENTCVPGNIVTINHLNYYPSILDTNDGYIFDNSKKESFYYYKINEKATIDRKEQSLDEAIVVEFAIWIKSTISVYNRKYTNFIDCMASIGGFAGFLFRIGKFINLIYYDFVLCHDFFQLLNDHFNEHNDNGKKENKENKRRFPFDKVNKINLFPKLKNNKNLSKIDNNSFNNLNNFSSNNIIQNQVNNNNITENANKTKLGRLNSFYKFQISINKESFTIEKIKKNLALNCFFYYLNKIKYTKSSKSYKGNLFIRRHIFSEEFIFQLYFMLLDLNKINNFEKNYFNDKFKESLFGRMNVSLNRINNFIEEKN